MAKRNSPNEAREAFAAHLREGRDARGLSQAAVVALCEGTLSPTTLSGWENSEQLPKADRLFELIAILRLPLTATCVLYAEALREQALEIRERARTAKRRGDRPGPRRRR